MTYYRADILAGALLLYLLFGTLCGINVLKDEALLLVNGIAIGAFLIVYAIRKRALEFTIVETPLPKERLLSLIKEVIEYYGWEIQTFSPDIVIVDDLTLLDRSFDPPLETPKLTGQRITIIFDHNKVYLNSILNLDSPSGWRGINGRKTNLDNVDIIREEILMEGKIKKEP